MFHRESFAPLALLLKCALLGDKLANESLVNVLPDAARIKACLLGDVIDAAQSAARCEAVLIVLDVEDVCYREAHATLTCSTAASAQRAHKIAGQILRMEWQLGGSTPTAATTAAAAAPLTVAAAAPLVVAAAGNDGVGGVGGVEMRAEPDGDGGKWTAERAAGGGTPEQ